MLKRSQVVCIGILVCMCLFVAVLLPACSSTPTAKNGDTVQVNYTLSLADGSIYQTTVGKEPLEFVLGEGNYLHDFQEAIVGMKVGESKTITILAADAYGEHRDDMILTINRSQLAAGVEPKVGSYLTSTNASGQTTVAIITAITDTTVTVDANHPLAGKDLTFKIELLKIS